jgi:hypothetical protein
MPSLMQPFFNKIAQTHIVFNQQHSHDGSLSNNRFVVAAYATSIGTVCCSVGVDTATLLGVVAALCCCHFIIITAATPANKLAPSVTNPSIKNREKEPKPSSDLGPFSRMAFSPDGRFDDHSFDLLNQYFTLLDQDVELFEHGSVSWAVLDDAVDWVMVSPWGVIKDHTHF